MSKWAKEAARTARMSGLKLWLRVLAPFSTTRSFQKVFFGALATGAAFALIRMIQTFSGSPLNGSRFYAILSLACPALILGLVFWVMRRQSIDAASLSARAASERVYKSLEQELAERERAELGLVAVAPARSPEVAQGEDTEAAEAAPRRRSNRL